MNKLRGLFAGITMSILVSRSSIGLLAAFATWSATAGPAVAAPDAPPQAGPRDADRHFEHAVALYMEADYRAALVEFLRAYELAPNAVVLFNIGETQYQLRDYPSALATFERYLGESPVNDSHRPLVETNLKELRTRVGRLTIATSPLGAEISIDDRVIGRTPFEQPVIVGIGRLNVRAYLPNHLPVTRTVDVAAEDNLAVNFDLPPAAAVRSEAGSFLAPMTPTEPPAPMNRVAWRKAGWITAGMLLAGAAGVGLWARDESNALRNARDTFPAKAKTVQTLSTRTLTLSVIADSLAAAGLIVGGVTLYSSLTAKETPSSPSTRLSAGVGSLTLEMTF